MSLELNRQHLIDAATQYGTPLYVYHAERINEQYQKLLSAFKHTDVRFFLCRKSAY